MSCEQKFTYEFVECLQSPAPSIHLHAGGVFAKGLEVFRRAYFLHNKFEQDCVDEARMAMLIEWGDFEPMFSWSDGAGPKNLDALFEALDFYLQTWPPATDPVRPWVHEGEIAVEFTFALPIPGSRHPQTGDPILYCGRFDQLALYNDTMFVEDDKTASQLGASWLQQWDMRSQFTGYCVKGTDEVLTPDGWKRLDALEGYQKIAQWDNGKIAFVQPSAIHKPHYTGPLLKADGKIHLCATPDHRQLLWDQYSKSYKTKAVKDISHTNGNLRFVSAGHLEGGDDYPTAFVQFLAAFQADGSWKDGTAMSFNFTKERKARRLESILNTLEVPFQKHNAKTLSYRINAGSQLAEQVDSFLGRDKLWGSWLLSFSQNNLRTLAEEVKFWDGTNYTETKWMYFSAIKSNVDWIATVCHMAGLHTSQHTQEMLHRLVITTGILHSTHLHIWGEEQWDGPVYCVTVPSSYFVIRSQGSIFITGNCWAAREYDYPVAGAIVRGISFLKNSFGSAQAITMREDWKIARWMQQLQRDVERMVHLFETRNPNLNLGETCTSYGGCPFTKLCDSPNPELWKSDYVRREWNPLTKL